MLTVLIHSLPTLAILVSLSFFIGIPVFRLWLVPARVMDDAGFSRGFSLRAQRLCGLGVVVLMVGSVLELLVRASEMAGPGVTALVSSVPVIILKTHYGMLWILRASAIAGLWGAWRLSHGRPLSGSTPIFMLVLAGFIAMTKSATGHAAGQGDFTIAEAADWLHLIAAMLWAGGTFTLLGAVIPAAGTMPERGQALADIQRRFSRMFYGLPMAGLVLTAWYNSWFSAHTFQALFRTESGLTILAKAALLFVMLAAASSAEWYGGREADRWAARFGRVVRVQAVIMLAILFSASLLRHQIPARHQLHMMMQQGMGSHEGMPHGSHGHAATRSGAEPDVVAALGTQSSAPKAGEKASLLLTLKDGKGSPVTGLTITHDRLVHVIIIGEDLETFAHIHPEDLGPVTDEMKRTGSFSLKHAFPKAGTYLVAVDTAVNDVPVSRTLRLGVVGKPAMAQPEKDLRRTKRFDAYTVELVSEQQEFQAGKEAAISFRITKGGVPVTDLEPYLSAAMHIAVVRSDLGSFLHTHGMVPASGGRRDAHGHVHMTAEGLPKKFGPDINAEIVFETSGLYTIFCEVMHERKARVFNFLVEVK